MISSHEHKDHILPLHIYFSVAAALLVLTIVTVWVSHYDFGNWNLIVAMVIAAAKGSLVALFFMHLKYDNKLYASFFVGAVVFLASFVVFTLFDTEARGRIYPDIAQPINPRAVIYGDNGEPLKLNPHAESLGEAMEHDTGEPALAPGGSAPANSGQDAGMETGSTQPESPPSTSGGH